MSDQIIVRPCTLDDVDGYAEMNLAFMKEVMDEHPYWDTLKMPDIEEMRETIQEAMANPDQIMLTLAEVNGQVAAYANSWTVYSIFSMGKALTVDDLYVLPEYRKLGVGISVMNYLFKYAEDNGYKRVQLHAETDNNRAHQLYWKLGFAEEDMLFFMKKI